jgi:molybdopterin-dependent oxidoreductase alpha subunit
MDTKRSVRTRDEEAKGYDPERSSDHEAFGGPDHYEAKEDLDDTKGEAPDEETIREETGVHAQPPAEFTGLKLGKHKEVAAGIPAVVSSMRYALRETGPIRGARLLTTMNQKDGFDCTSCAWPDPDEHRSVAEFCENGAKAVLDEGTVKRVTLDFFKKHSVAELSERSDFWLNNQGRLTHPMFLRKGGTHYEPIGWEDAFDKLGAELNALASPDEAIFYTSGRASNEAAFLYQLFVRQYGTNNMPDCSNMCHESSGTALSATLGLGKGSVTLEDFYHTDLIMILGQNPGTNHPRMMSALERGKKNGAKIVAINPLPETGFSRFKNPQDYMHPVKAVGTLLGSGTQLADIFVSVRIGGDVPLLKGVMKELLDEEERRPGEVFDHAFIAANTEGFEAFIEDLRAEDWERIVSESGIDRRQIREVADMVLAAPRTIICWAMGLTQHTNAVSSIQEIVNLLLLRGSIGKPGAGTCPVRGHSNVQGDRSMGIWERPQKPFLDALQREFNFEPPREHGFDTVEAIKAMHEGRGKVFLALGGNFLSATPDTEYTAEALQNCRLSAHISTKLNRAHLVHGEEALILPCLGRTEVDVQASGPQFVTMENSMGVVHDSQGMLKPASRHLRSEVAIIAGIAEATLGARSTVAWDALKDDYNRIREHISRVIPGCENYSEKVRGAGFYLPNGPRERTFTTDTKKAKFTVHPIPERPLEKGQYIMMSIRTHDQFNTVVYGLDDRYRGIRNERRVIMMNADDMAEAGIKKGDVLDLTSHFNGETREARRFIAVPYPIPRRCTATYFPETNVLVALGSVAQGSNTPVSKYVVITVAPSRYRGDFDPSFQHGKAGLEPGRPASGRA